jgi:hypothetical protein
MRSSFIVALSFVLVAGLAAGQCSTLAVAGSINAGQTVSIGVSGAPADSATFLAVGETAGSTSIMVPGSTLVLGLAEPFAVLPLGVTDAAGAVSLSVSIPADVPAGSLPDATFILQAVTVSFGAIGPIPMPIVLTFCVSNTATLVSGNG